MKHAFRRCGKVKSVYFHNEPTPIEPEVLPSKYFVPKSIKVSIHIICINYVLIVIIISGLQSGLCCVCAHIWFRKCVVIEMY